MASQELVPLSDELKDYEDYKANKRELIFENRHGMEIIISWLRNSNTILMELIEEESRRAFLVPNTEVLQARDHPEVYAAFAKQPRRDRHE